MVVLYDTLNSTVNIFKTRMLIILVSHIIAASRGPRFVFVYAVNYNSHIDIVGY